MREIVPLLASWGWRSLDLNFCEMMNPSHDIGPGYIRELKGFKEEYGLEYVQSHAPYPRQPWDQIGASSRNKILDDIKAALDYSSELGVKAAVIHPFTKDAGTNAEMLRALAERLPDSTVLALENMESPEEVSTADEINAIIALAGTPRLKACLDTGHAHMRGLDIPTEISKYGSNLAATHIADNHGRSDEHLLPFFGAIPWEKVMPAFRHIGYKGSVTYECMFFTRNLPEALLRDASDLALKTGDILLEMMKA